MLFGEESLVLTAKNQTEFCLEKLPLAHEHLKKNLNISPHVCDPAFGKARTDYTSGSGSLKDLCGERLNVTISLESLAVGIMC